MQVVSDFLRKHHINNDTFAIGVSGGADSLALALLFKEAYPQFHLIALTVDHQLRPSSRKEALYVAEVMKRFGIEHHILPWEGEKPQTGIEEQARIARYHLLCHWCKQHNVKYLAIAHHLFDQAETFLMRLQRGSGLFGLSSMQEISNKDGITILRPLLNINPQDLKEYLEQQNIAWVEDESNQNTDYLRVTMRKFLPILEEKCSITPSDISLAVENLQRTREFIEVIVQQTIQDSVHMWDDCGCSFDKAIFLQWHEELQFHILGQLIKNIGNQIYIPEAEALMQLISQLKSADFCGATLGGVYFCICDLRIWLIKEYRTENLSYSEKDWADFEKERTDVRGIKIPAKLKQALLYEKNHKK